MPAGSGAVVLRTPTGEPEDGGTGGFTSVVRRVFGGESSAIKVKGHDDLLVYRARCCNPIRGEEIVGYVTRGKGVAVHSKSCPNVMNLMYEPERRIAVEWGKDGNVGRSGQAGYPVKLAVLCDNRPGMLKQIATVISDSNTNIRNMEAKTSRDHAMVDIVADIADLKHLERIVSGSAEDSRRAGRAASAEVVEKRLAGGLTEQPPYGDTAVEGSDADAPKQPSLPGLENRRAYPVRPQRRWLGS